MPLIEIATLGAFCVQIAWDANAPVLQLLVSELPLAINGKSLVSKFSPLVWPNIAHFPGCSRVRREPLPRVWVSE